VWTALSAQRLPHQYSKRAVVAAPRCDVHRRFSLESVVTTVC
jgi:hypothetical protein